MGFFSKVADFFSSTPFQIGSAVLGTVAGTGALGTVGQGISAAANLASGASSIAKNGASFGNVAQTALGAANFGQATGMVPSFQDIPDKLFGSGTSQPGTKSAGLDDDNLFGGFNEKSQPAIGGGGTDQLPDQPASVPTEPAKADGALNLGTHPDLTKVPDAQFGLQFNAPAIADMGGGKPGAITQGGANNSTSFFQNLGKQMAANPVTAIGSTMMVASLFMPNKAEEQYNEAVKTLQDAANDARTRANLESPAAQQWMGNWMTTMTSKVEEEYKIAVADMAAKHASRGIEDSTIAGEERAALAARFAKVKVEMPMQSQLAYLQYQQGLTGVANASMAPAAAVAQAQAGQAALLANQSANTQRNFSTAGAGFGKIATVG